MLRGTEPNWCGKGRPCWVGQDGGLRVRKLMLSPSTFGFAPRGSNSDHGCGMAGAGLAHISFPLFSAEPAPGLLLP